MQRPNLQFSENPQTKQSIQFLTSKDINPSINLIINHYIKLNKITPQNVQISNISFHLEKFLKFVIEKNTSFVVRQNGGSNQVIGCCLNLDVKDLISIFDTSMNFAVFQQLGMFTQKLKNWLYKLGDSSRGDYLYNAVTVFQQNQLHNNPADYIIKGIAFSKVIGWKNILYPTADPFLMLKFGAQIIGVIKNDNSQNLYLQENSGQNIVEVENQKIQLEKVSFESFIYVTGLKLKTTSVHYIDVQYEQKQHDLVDSYETKNQDVAKKLYILPKL